MMYNIYITETSAVQVASERLEGALYRVGGDKYTWLPRYSNVLPPDAEQISPFAAQYVSHIKIWHNSIDADYKVLLKAICKYPDNSITIWALDDLHYADSRTIAGTDFNRYADLYIPDTADLRSLFPRRYSDGSRATLEMTEYLVEKDSNGTELSFIDDSTAQPYLSFSSTDPNERIVGLSAHLSKNHIVVDIVVPDKYAFLKKYNSGYACYKISGYKNDGTVNTSTTTTGVAERTLVSTDKCLISLNDCLNDMSFNIMPKFVDVSITDIVVEVSAVFWKDSHTSLEDMHTGVVDCEAVYITRDPVSMSEKIPLANGFYNISWEDGLVLYSGSATPFMESQQFSHVPGPSRLKVYNCIKESDPVQKGNNNGYTMFKIQADKEQVVTMPTSIIVPFNEVICTVGVAALESLDNQTDTPSTNLWTSQK